MAIWKPPMENVAMKRGKLRLAVVGGGIGQYGILPAFLLDPRIEVVAVSTSREETAQSFAKKFNIPKAYGSWQKLLEEEIDIVAIATPPLVQQEITDAFISRKIPLFLEKQIGLDLLRSQHWLSKVQEHQIPTCVNFIFPELHTWRLMHNYLKEGRVGPIRHVFLNWRMESYDHCRKTPYIWKTVDALGGGVLQHFLSHSFHYLENLFGEIKQLRCTLSSAPDLSPNGSSSATLDLIFENGLIVHVAASNAAYSGIGHTLEIYGSEGALFLKNETKDPVLGFKLYSAMRGKEVELIDAEAAYHPYPLSDSRIPPIKRLVDQFIDSVEGKVGRHPTLKEGYRVQFLLDCAKRAAESHTLLDVKRTTHGFSTGSKSLNELSLF